MKRILNIVWSAILLGIFIIWGINYWGERKIKISGDSINQLVDSLFMDDHGICLITIGYRDCHLCEILVNSDYYKNLDVPKYYINPSESSDNKLLSQVLYTKGFPTTYVINNEYEILGVIKGIPFFQARLDSIFYLSKRICNIEIEDVGRDSVLDLLTMTFRASICYWKNDHNKMKEYALNSFGKGSYFFNNYLMYLVYKEENERDSASIYKKRALKHGHHVNAFIYDNLIQELTEAKW